MKKVLLTLAVALVASVAVVSPASSSTGTPFKVRADIDNRMEFCAYTERYVQMRGRYSGAKLVVFRCVNGLHNSVTVRVRFSKIVVSNEGDRYRDRTSRFALDFKHHRGWAWIVRTSLR